MIRYSKVDNSIRNIAWGIANKILVVIWPFIIRTLMIQKMGVEYLGLSSLFTSIISMMSLAELGFGSAMVYAMYKPIAEQNYEEINALLAFYKKIYRYIGLVVLVIGVILIPFLPNLINGSYPDDINLYILYFIYLANTVCSYWLFAYKSSILTAYQRTDIMSKITGVAHMAMYALQCVILLTIKNYYAYVIILPVSTLVINLSTAFVTKKLYPKIVGYGKISKETKISIGKRVTALFGHKLGAIVTNSTDNIVISAFLGLNILAVYNNYYQIITSLIGIFSIINNSLIAGLGNSIVTASIKKNYRILKGITFCNVWIIGWCSICLLCLFQPFITLWVGSEYLFSMGTVVLMTVYFYIWKFKDMLSIYKDAAGMWQDDKWKPVVYCIVNIIVSVALVKFIGVAGVIIGTIVSQIFVAIPWETVVFFKKYIYRDETLKGELRIYTRNMFLYTIIWLCVAILTILLCLNIKVQSIFLQLIIRGLICIVVPNILFLTVFCKTDEFEFAKDVLNKYVIKIEKRGPDELR